MTITVYNLTLKKELEEKKLEGKKWASLHFHNTAKVKVANQTDEGDFQWQGTKCTVEGKAQVKSNDKWALSSYK